MTAKDRKDERSAKRQEDKEQDRIDDYNKLGKEYYYNEETDKSVFHDNRHDSGNR